MRDRIIAILKRWRVKDSMIPDIADELEALFYKCSMEADDA